MSEPAQKWVFLDIDGVLNTPQTWGAWARLGHDESLEPELVKRLAMFIEQAELKVVLCSTWRISSAGLVGTVMCLTRRGWPHARRYLIGETPFMPGEQRGVEIGEWLKANRVAPDDIVILDDATDMAAVAHRHVPVNYEIGLTDDDVKRARVLLGLPF